MRSSLRGSGGTSSGKTGGSDFGERLRAALFTGQYIPSSARVDSQALLELLLEQHLALKAAETRLGVLELEIRRLGDPGWIEKV